MIARQVLMVRPTLEDVPAYTVPPGFRLRRYRPGDAVHWTRIQRAADRYNDVDDDLFRRAFGHDEQLLAARQYYVVDGEDVPVGTATAWYWEQKSGTMSGLVHWVAVHPHWQGRGLSRPLLGAVCERLRHEGHTHAYLRTDPRRRRAINLYLSFDFRPVIWNEADRQTWRTLAPALRYEIQLPDESR